MIDDFKNNRPEDVVRRLLDIFFSGLDASERCDNLSPEEIRNYLYPHLNRDGQKCVDGILALREVVYLI